jgi:hypothetical protein
MAALLPDVQQTYNIILDKAPSIEPDITETIDGCEVKSRSVQNKVKVVRQKIEILRETLDSLEK